MTGPASVAAVSITAAPLISGRDQIGHGKEARTANPTATAPGMARFEPTSRADALQGFREANRAFAAHVRGCDGCLGGGLGMGHPATGCREGNVLIGEVQRAQVEAFSS